MMQLKSAGSVAEALSIMVQATSLNSADASKLTALLQNSEEDSSEEFGAPAAAVFKSSSGGIVQTLQDLFEKAEAQLEEARKTETKSVQAYAMLAQSLADEIKFGNSDMDKAKKGLATSEGSKATAEGALAVTNKDLAADTETLADLHQECMTKSQAYEAEVKSRDEELKALAAAKKAIADNTGNADSFQYGLVQTSFLQVSSNVQSASRFVWDLAQKQGSTA